MKAEKSRDSDPAEGNVTTTGSPVADSPASHDGSHNGSTLPREAEGAVNDLAAGLALDAPPTLLQGEALPTVERARKPSRRFLPAIPAFSLDDGLGRLALSAVLALLLWFYVINLENPEQTTVFKGLTVEVRGAGPDLKVINAIPTVDSVVQAPQDVMGTFRQSDIKPYIDLTGLTEGVHEIPLRIEVTAARAGAAQISVSPKTVQVQLEAQVSIEHTVVVQSTGTPAFGYVLEPAQVEPGRVRAVGPREAVSKIAQVIAPVDVDEKASTQRGLRTTVALDSEGKEITGITFDPANVQVTVPIKLLFNYKVVGVRPHLIGQPAPGYRVLAITLNPTNVTICCKPEVLEPLQSLDTTPITITGSTATLTATSQLILPQDVELYPGQKKTVDVTVTFERLESTLQVSVAPAVEGLAEGVTAVVSPNKFDLVLSGTFSQLQGLKPTDVRVLVSMQGRQPGTYELQPQVILPEGVKLVNADPLKITVTLLAPTPVPPTPPPPTAVPPTQTTAPAPPPTSTAVPARPTNSIAPATVTVPQATPRPTNSLPPTTATTAPATATVVPSSQSTPSAVTTPTALQPDLP